MSDENIFDLVDVNKDKDYRFMFLAPCPGRKESTLKFDICIPKQYIETVPEGVQALIDFTDLFPGPGEPTTILV